MAALFEGSNSELDSSGRLADRIAQNLFASRREERTGLRML
jgi:hypothetical protein